MANTVEELNYSGKKLVVDSIEVINRIEGQQITQIKSNVNAMQQLVESTSSSQRNYWSQLSDDGKITPAEKKTLQKEWLQIKETYTNLETEATTRGIQDSSTFNTYESLYGALNTLLNSTLKLFDNMKVTTTIPDREVFDKAYADYYAYENYCQMVLADKTSNDYWSQLSEDQYISPAEKKTLLNQFKGIKASFEGYQNQAESKGMVTNPFFTDYYNTYNSLYTYLYTTVKLFDNMGETTVIASRETFNEHFQDYYEAEANLNITFNAAIIDASGIRVLTSLEETGNDGDVALYRGTWYQYVVDSTGHGMWVATGADNFAGVLNELPASEIENMYFMAGTDFTLSIPLSVTSNGQILGLQITTTTETAAAVYLNYTFVAGFIYLYQNGTWTKLTNTSDYRYMQAMLEYFNVTGQLPGVFKDTINQAVDKAISDSNVVTHLPKYLHKSVVDPADGVDGDIYCYSGETTNYRKKSYLYKKINGVWTELSPTDTANNGTDYMGALDDILSLNKKDTGYFAAIFLQALYGHDLFADLLNTFNIVLKTINGKSGSIQSDNFIAGSQGIYLGANGKAELQDAVIRGAITATTLTLGSGASVPGDKVSGQVSSAASADSATSAGTADSATYATSAGSATSATNATNVKDGYMKNLQTDLSNDPNGWAFRANWKDDGTTGCQIMNNGNVYFNNGNFRGNIYADDGYFKGDITGASGTFEDKVEASSLSIKTAAGDLEIGNLSVELSGSHDQIWGYSITVPVHGSIRITMVMFDNSTAPIDKNTTYYLYKNNLEVKKFTFVKGNSAHTETFDLNVTEGDILSAAFGDNAGGRSSNANITCTFKASVSNPIVKAIIKGSTEEYFK